MERYRLLTCIVPSGRGTALLEKLRDTHALTSAFAHHAREVTFHSSGRGQNIADESEIITVLVAEAKAEALFDELREAAGIDEPGGGMLLMEPTLGGRASPMPQVAPEA